MRFGAVLTLAISCMAIGSPLNHARASAAEFDTHPLAGNWVYESYYVNIGPDAELTTNVKTPAGYDQIFEQRLQRQSSSPTGTHYAASGYFRYTHGNFPYQVACRHPVRIDILSDGSTGTAIIQFRSPQRIWAVWDQSGGHCHSSGTEVRQAEFERSEGF